MIGAKFHLLLSKVTNIISAFQPDFFLYASITCGEIVINSELSHYSGGIAMWYNEKVSL